jgi:hypothetical protein
MRAFRRSQTTMSADDSDRRGRCPMHVAVRKYANAGQLADAIAQREQEVRGILSGIPGFVAYYAVGTGETLVTVSVYQDQAGATESTRRAAEWVKQNLPGATIGSPEVTEGEALVQF